MQNGKGLRFLHPSVYQFYTFHLTFISGYWLWHYISITLQLLAIGLAFILCIKDLCISIMSPFFKLCILLIICLVLDVGGSEVSGGFGQSSSGIELQLWNEQRTESDSENTSQQPRESKPKQSKATQTKPKPKPKAKQHLNPNGNPNLYMN